MSLILRSMNSMGGIIASTTGTLLRGAQSTVQIAYAAPGALTNASVNAVSSVASGILHLAKSAAAGVKNTTVNATSAVARGGWGLTKSAAGGLKRGTVYLLNTGKEAAVAKSVHHYAELFFRIQIVKDKIWSDLSGKVPLNQFNRNELAERLEEFIELYSLSADDKAFIAGLCADLRNVSVVFNPSKEAEMGRLEQILSPYFVQHQSYILSKKTERDELKKVPFLSTSAPLKLTPEQTLEGIKQQVDLLKSNATKLVLGSVILNMTLGLYTCDQIDIEAFKKTVCRDFEFPPTEGKNTNLVNFLIEITNKAAVEGMSSEELFKKLVYRAIDFSGHGLLARIHAKFRCLYTSSLIANLMGNLVDNIKDTLVHFAHLPPAKQLEEITALLIDPLLKYFNDIENGQPPQPVTTAPAAPVHPFWAALFKRNQPGPKTPDELLDHFIEVLLSQFLDKKYQPWTRTALTSFTEKAYSSAYLVKVFYLTLAGLMWIVGKIIAPLQWTLNETIHYLLRTTIIGLCPGLTTSTKDSLEIGKPHAWYTLKSSLLLMLQQIRLTALLPKAEDPAYQPPRQIPAEVTAKFSTLLDILFREMGEEPLPNAPDAPLVQASTSSIAINTFLSSTAAAIIESIGEDPVEAKRIRDEEAKQLVNVAQQNLNGGDLSWLKDLIKTSLTELTLDMCAQEGFMNQTLLAALTSTNARSFAATTVPVADAEKQRIDTELNQELGLLGPAILQSVNEATRTDKKYQREANIFIKSLQQEVENFQRDLLEVHQNPDLSFTKESQTLSLKFLQTLGRIRMRLVENVDEPTQALLMPYFTEALRYATQIASYVKGTGIENTRIQVEEKLDKLYALLKSPLDNEKEIDEALKELKLLNPSFLDLQAIEEALNTPQELLASLAQPLSMLIAGYKDRANREIEKTRKQVVEKLDQFYSYLEMPLDNEEEIDAALKELRALNPAFIDLNAFEAHLYQRLGVYVERFGTPEAREKHPNFYAKPLLMLIADYKDRANKEIEKTRKQVEAKFDELYSDLEMPLDNEEKIFTTLMELRTLYPSFIDHDAFETALNGYHKAYIEPLESSKKRKKLSLLALIADRKVRANGEANTRIQKFKPLEADLRGKLAPFDAWAKGLKFVKVKAQPTVNDAAMAHVYSSPTVGALASAGIQSYARNLFTFIGDEENLAGIAQRGMEAYLNKPAMMPKREDVSESFFPWRNRHKSPLLTEVEQAKLSARGWVALNHK